MLRNVSQLSIFGLETKIWSVADLNRYIRQLLEADYRLQDLWVAGEISNLSRPASGHVYFTLKDAQASLRCVMWRPDAARLSSIIADGIAAEAHGYISVFESGGQYQLYVDDLRPAGEGLLYQEFLRLKARLEEEGLFATERKRPLPDWPRRIGVITSPTGAALRDVLHVLQRRFSLAEVILAPSPVQGEHAPAGIVESLRALNEHSKPDVILLVRGGGSIEDLWAFNDEHVARAIAASQAPVVSGVGHETDFTIADFTADVRAPTPSAAAEIATPDAAQLAMEIQQLRISLTHALRQLLHRLQLDLEILRRALHRASPRAKITDGRQRLDVFARRVQSASLHTLALKRKALDGLQQTLRVVGPASVLSRGFAVVQRADTGAIVRSVGQVFSGDALDVRVSDGSFGAKVTSEDQSQER